MDSYFTLSVPYVDFWHELIPQAEITLNMMRAFADQRNISAYHGIHRKPYDFISHPRPMRHADSPAQLTTRDMGQLWTYWFLPRARGFTLSVVPLPRPRH
jgi:hypothetical protein